MTKEAWIRFCRSLKEGDILFLHATDFTAEAIQWGSDVNDKITIAHVFNYKGEGNGVTIEADGVHVCGRHFINDYMDRVINDKARLIVFRVLNPQLSTTEIQGLETFWNTYKDCNYNGWENFWFGVWGVVSKINYGFACWLSTNFTNPAWQKNSMNCSQESIGCFQIAAPRVYNPVVADKPIQNMTPNELILRISRVAINIMDTLHYA